MRGVLSVGRSQSNSLVSNPLQIILLFNALFAVKSSTTQIEIQDVAVTNRDLETRTALGAMKCTSTISSKMVRASIRPSHLTTVGLAQVLAQGSTNQNGPSADPPSLIKSTDAVERDPSVIGG